PLYLPGRLFQHEDVVRSNEGHAGRLVETKSRLPHSQVRIYEGRSDEGQLRDRRQNEGESEKRGADTRVEHHACFLWATLHRTSSWIAVRTQALGPIGLHTTGISWTPCQVSLWAAVRRAAPERRPTCDRPGKCKQWRL